MPDAPKTIKDVAAKAGVSIAAVSKVLHGSGTTVRVGTQTAERIQKAAKDLNYRPNRHARSLRLNRSYTVGLIFHGIDNLSKQLFKVHVLDGVHDAVIPAGYDVILLHDLSRGPGYSQFVDGDRFDGLIWARLSSFEQFSGIVQQVKSPMVALSTPSRPGLPLVPKLCCNNRQGMDLLIDHLWKLGHRQYAYLTESYLAEMMEPMDREEGFCEAVGRRGGDFEIVRFNDAASEVYRWMEQGRYPGAVIGWNEDTAGYVLESALKLGIQVPNEISVAGFDSTWYCDTTSPRLTSVRQPILQMATDAAAILLALIEGEAAPVLERSYPCTLDCRESTAEVNPRFI